MALTITSPSGAIRRTTSTPGFNDMAMWKIGSTQIPGRLGGTSGTLSGGIGPGDPVWATSESQSQRREDMSGGQRFADPGLAQGTATTAMNLGTNLAGRYDDLVKNPQASPLMQNAIAAMLTAGHPSMARAGANVAQLVRAGGAGGAIPTSYGGAAGQAFSSEAARARMGATSNLMATLFPSIAQATYAPVSQVPGLAEALKLGYTGSGSTATSSSSSARPVFPPEGYTGGGGLTAKLPTTFIPTKSGTPPGSTYGVGSSMHQ